MAIEPKIAKHPTISGIMAATRPPKTQTSTAKLIGRAMASLTDRSRRVCSLTSALATPRATSQDSDAARCGCR